MSLLIYICIVALLIAALLIFVKSKKVKKFGIILVITAVLLEVFVFNFHSFHLIGGDYEEFSLELEDAMQYNFDSERTDFVSNSGGRQMRLRFSDINKKIGTVVFDIEYEFENNKYSPSDYIDVIIDASDETNSADFRNNVAKGTLIRGDDRSQCIILDLSGKVKDIQFKMQTAPQTCFRIKSVTFNSPKPLHFSSLRLLTIVGISFALYAIVTFPSLKKACNDDKKRWNALAFTVTGVFVGCAVILTMLYNYNAGGYFFSNFNLTTGNQISKELVDAFKAGQVHLLDTPGDDLLSLENPYDWSLRIAEQVPSKWDHLLYEGKYYSYYGIAPVLILFLPYNLITGYYFPTPVAVLIFGAVGIVFLSLLFMEMIKRFFKNIPINIALCSLIVLQLSSGIMYCFCSPLFYEIAQASGFMFTMMGLYFLIRCGVVGNGKISFKSLCASSFCLSMAVLCRPTLALYCIAALVFIGFGFFKNLRNAREADKSPIRSSIGYLACALSCFVVIGGIQMLYNYMRFGSVFDFGIQYSITINDFTKSQYHTDFAAIGFWNFLLAFPIVRPEFPFVFSNFSTLDANGYYFVANKNAIGLLWRALPMFGYLGFVPAYRKLPKKYKLPALLTVLTTCVAAPAVIIFSIWESGYGVRYSADFAVELIIGGIMIIYFLYQSVSTESKKVIIKFTEVFFAVALFVAFVANFALIYDYLSKSGYLADEFLRFERLFEFWR